VFLGSLYSGDQPACLHEVDHGGAVLLDEALRAFQEIIWGDAEGFILLEQTLPIFELGLSAKGSTAGIRSAFFSRRMAGMAAGGLQLV